MPEIKHLEDGKVEVSYETGERFTGTVDEVMNKMGEAHSSTKRWAQNIRAENENLKAQRYEPSPSPQPVQNADETALQNYLLDQQAKALGFKTGEEYKQRLNYVGDIVDQQSNNMIAEAFMTACPEFPNTQDAIDKLARKVEDLGWQFNQQSLMGAHMLCLREKAYDALTPEQVNAAWSNQMAIASGAATPSRGNVPPTPPPSGAPHSADNTNPWQMSKDELTKKVLEGGGLGKALMDLPPGGSLTGGSF